MDREYWIKKWQQDKAFVIEKDRIKKKAYIYTPFPKTNQYGFQNGDIRRYVVCDILARYERMQGRNILFPTGCHSLCHTSFVENKKYSNLLNDDISEMYNSQMAQLGIGINEGKHIDMRHEEYLSNLQQAFLDLYDRGYIEYKDTRVYWDKKKNKIYDFMNHPKGCQAITQRCFVLKIKEILPKLLQDIQELEVSVELKERLSSAFSPKRILKLELSVSNGSCLEVRLSEPQYMGGISFIFLNPEYIDITQYVDINEYQSVFSYLEGEDKDALFAFSGLYARNPLTGKEIPIFISTMFQQEIYLGIPGIDEDDRLLAEEEGLEMIPLLENDRLTHSDFLDTLSPEEAKQTVFDAFTEAELAQTEILYQHDEIVLSSLDNFGPLFPFLEDKDTNEIFSLAGHLPYAFSSKLRPVLADNVDIVGTTMNGTMNNLFTEGICPILAMIYDNIGSVISIFSDEALEEFQSWNGVDYMLAEEQDIYSSLLMPMIFYRIIERERGVVLPKLFHQLELCSKTVDIALKDIKRANNNLIDMDTLLKSFTSDAIRLFSVSAELSEPFVFDRYRLEDIHKELQKAVHRLSEAREENATVDYALFTLIKGVNEALSRKNIQEYAFKVHGFLQEYVLPYGLSRRQILVLLRLIYPLLPFMAEDIYAELTGSKYSISNEDWPI